jgi:hypothetical protein
VLKTFGPVIVISLFALWLGAVNKRSPSVRGTVQANATDSWLGMVIPALKNPPEVLRALGVPERCDAFVGETWYSPGMQPPWWDGASSTALHCFSTARFSLQEPTILSPSAHSAAPNCIGETGTLPSVAPISTDAGKHLPRAACGCCHPRTNPSLDLTQI